MLVLVESTPCNSLTRGNSNAARSFSTRLLQPGLDPHGHDLVLVDEDIDERIEGHRAEPHHAVLEEPAPVAPDLVEEPVEADGLVRDVGVDLAVGVLAEDVEDREHPAREHREEREAQGFEAPVGRHDVEHVAVGPFLPVARVVAVGLLEVAHEAGVGLGAGGLDRVDAEGKSKSPTLCRWMEGSIAACCILILDSWRCGAGGRGRSPQLYQPGQIGWPPPKAPTARESPRSRLLLSGARCVNMRPLRPRPGVSRPSTRPGTRRSRPIEKKPQAPWSGE